MDEAPIGLIAAGGRLPVATAEGIRRAGRRCVCVGLRDQYEADLPGLCDQFKAAGVIQIGRWIRLLRKWGASEAVLVGKVAKVAMHDPLRLVRHRPDLIAAKVWFVATRDDKRPDALLGAVADELDRKGITLIDSTTYIPTLMADEGVMTQTQPTAVQQADIAFGLPIAQRMGDLDVGQSIAVKDRDVLAVEALEGTDQMIGRAGALCRAGGWTLIKIAKPRQDMRFDVPTVGMNTIERLTEARAGCLAIEAGKTIMLDKPRMIAAADRAGLAIVGVRVG